MKKLLTLALVAFLLFFAAKNPTGAAQVTKAVGHGLAAAGTGLGNALTQLVS